MLANHLRLLIRNLLRKPVFAFINVTGLAIGLASAILIFLFVRHELSFDTHFPQADRLYRVLTIDKALGLTSNQVGVTLPAIGPAMLSEFPEVDASLRMILQGEVLYRDGDKSYYSDQTLLAESSIFDVFGFDLEQGDIATALTRPQVMVVTESFAMRVFGTTDVVGKTLIGGNNQSVEITGWMKDVPANTHFTFDVLQSMVPSDDNVGFQNFLTSWGSISLSTYIRLSDGANPDSVIAKMEPLVRRNNVGENFTFSLQPVLDMRMHSSDIIFDDLTLKSDIRYIRILGAVGIFILLIACFNFMNLSTARSSERAKETGLRKVMGAFRAELIRQHLTESVALTFLSMIIAVVLVELSIPQLHSLLNTSLDFPLFSSVATFGVLVAFALVVALLAGSYPAFVLSSFQPITVLKGEFTGTSKGKTLRKVLVISQFSVSIVMIIGTMLVSRQLDYVRNLDQGYQRDHVITLTLNSNELNSRQAILRERLMDVPGVMSVGRSNTIMGLGIGRNLIRPEGFTDDDIWIMSAMSIDDGFIPTLGVKLAEGRNFSESFGTDQSSSVLLNETAVRALGWDEPIGKEILTGPIANPTRRQVVGVVNDFHFKSVREQIEPLFITYNPNQAFVISMKIAAGNISNTVADIEAIWKEVNPEYPFSYVFLDDTFNDLYQDDARFSQVMTIFAFLAIFIACLGLFGLAAFVAEQRTHEIGVRKVLGAKVGDVVMLLTSDFMKLVLIAFVVACPLAWLVMSDWLSSFAYHIDIGPTVFLIAGVLASGIASLTISGQAFKSAIANPIRALRHE
jgi:putative ABC transport system permease protein